MKTVVLLVKDDDAAQTVLHALPEQTAWLLDARYDRFRCGLHASLESYYSDQKTFSPLEGFIASTESWLLGEKA